MYRTMHLKKTKRDNIQISYRFIDIQTLLLELGTGRNIYRAIDGRRAFVGIIIAWNVQINTASYTFAHCTRSGSTKLRLSLCPSSHMHVWRCTHLYIALRPMLVPPCSLIVRVKVDFSHKATCQLVHVPFSHV